MAENLYVALIARAHIVGISKTTYVLATPRCVDWRHDLQQSSRNHDRGAGHDGGGRRLGRGRSPRQAPLSPSAWGGGRGGSAILGRRRRRPASPAVGLGAAPQSGRDRRLAAPL